METESQKQLYLKDEALIFVVNQRQARVYDAITLELFDNYDLGEKFCSKHPTLISSQKRGREILIFVVL